MSLNLASIPLKSAADHAEAPAILVGDVKISYQALKQQIQLCASLLQSQGVGKGDHVALLLPNVPQFTVNYFAVHYLGAVVVPLNVLFVEDELKYHLDDSDTKSIVVWESFLDNALPAARAVGCSSIMVCRPPDSDTDLPDGTFDQAKLMQELASTQFTCPDMCATNADDSAVILYTSGTTGRAKGAELTHFNIYDNARFVAERLMRTEKNNFPVFTQGDVALAALPLFHSFGQTVIQNAFLMHGAAISLLPRFTPKDALQLIEGHKVSFFAGVPSMYIALLNDPTTTPDKLATLKCAVSGGAALPTEVLNQFHDRFGIQIQEGYGLSETSPVACFNMLTKGCKPGTVGTAIDLCEVKIVDDNRKEVITGERGEVTIKGSNVMKGYYKQPVETAEVLHDGWFHTGDIGTMDEEGFVSIVDRKKEMIIRGGFNIYPREIEEVLYAHPQITEAAVIGIPDKIHGEEVMAIIATSNNEPIAHEDLERYCREHLAAYKVPRLSKQMEQLPKGATGKILKRTLKEEYV